MISENARAITNELRERQHKLCDELESIISMARVIRKLLDVQDGQGDEQMAHIRTYCTMMFVDKGAPN